MAGKKQCSRCRKELSLDSFGKKKRSKDGLNSWCKECNKEYARQYRADNKELVNQRHLDYYYKNLEKVRSYKKKYASLNKEKITEKRRKYYEANREREIVNVKKYQRLNRDQIIAASRSYRKKNREVLALKYSAWCKTDAGRELKRQAEERRRARKAGLRSDFTRADWFRCLEFFNNSCAYCGKHSEILHQDHFIPVSKGGGYCVGNILPSCPSCNFSKKDSLFAEWFKKQPFYSLEREAAIYKYFQMFKEAAVFNG